MTLAEIRDYVIIIYGFLWALFAVVLLVMAFLLYRKIMGILTAVRAIAHNIETFSKNVLKPFAKGAQNASPILKILGMFRGDKEEDEDRKAKEHSR